jgi:hypothetical protein
MFAKISVRCAGVALAGLMSCTSDPDVGRVYPALEAVPPPEVSVDLPLERVTPPKDRPARACLLGSAGTCMEMDSRPFEPCLVTSKVCEREGARIVPLAPEAPADPEAPPTH